MIVKKEKSGGVDVYYLSKNITDEEMNKLKNTFVKKSQIDLIIKDDADIYNEDGKLLMRYRKNKLSKKNIDEFYDNVINFAKQVSTNRGSACGSKKKNVMDNPKIMSNILGYMDNFSPKQKYLMNCQNKKINLNVRETRFNADYPDKFQKIIPLIKEIDGYYKKYASSYYSKQRRKANQTNFKIPGTSFTTITTNVNFRTSIHKDSGDDEDGFGNLTVIDRGKYEGAETCFPQYGVGVNVREKDVLFMNVHEWHGNLPMEKKDKDAIRLSIVCYLRMGIWKKTQNISKSEMIKHNLTIKNLRNKNNTKKKLDNTKKIKNNTDKKIKKNNNTKTKKNKAKKK
jgi:hypothetical protein